jgi:hypothetical protein
MKSQKKNTSGEVEKTRILSEEELPELNQLIRQSKLRNRILQKISENLNDPERSSLGKQLKK